MEQAFGQRIIICVVAQNRGRFALRKDGSSVPSEAFRADIFPLNALEVAVLHVRHLQKQVPCC